MNIGRTTAVLRLVAGGAMSAASGPVGAPFFIG
jgi:hypothetical protein